MKALIWFIVLFGLAAAVAIGAQHYPGEVYIVTGSDMRHLNLNTFIISLILAMVAIYFIVKLINGLLNAPRNLRHMNDNRHSRNAERALNEAGLAYFEGRFEKAQQLADKILENKQGGSKQALALLMAAHSADHLGDFNRRDAYLEKMDKFSEKSQLARHLLLAKAALKQSDYAQALQALEAAKNINPNLTQLVQLQLRYAHDTRDAQAMLSHTEKLYKAGVLSASEAAEERLSAYRSLLAQANDSGSLKTVLKRIPEADKSGTLVCEIAERYQQLGLYEQAVAWINKYYPKQQHPRLLDTFARSSAYLADAQQRKNMEEAEGWLKTHPQDADLLLCLGQIAYQKQLWGKAQSYLEASLALTPSAQANLMLAKVFDESGKPEQAEEARNRALMLVAEQNPAPALAAPAVL